MAQYQRPETYDGFCTVCGTWNTFNNMARSIRETYQCKGCRASQRERATASAIVAAYGAGQATSLAQLIKRPNFSSLRIYEPGVSGAYRRFFKDLNSYHNSFFFSDKARGEMVDGVRNEDLMNLSYQDASFDLAISSDIFEHIRRPWEAFSEINRVLRMGGMHIFSIPVMTPMRTVTEYPVDTSGDTDIYIKEPRYHGDGKGGRSLVYTDFGSDMYDRLRELGFQTFTISNDHTDRERTRVISLITLKVAEAGPRTASTR